MNAGWYIDIECPHCNAALTQPYIENMKDVGSMRCCACGRIFGYALRTEERWVRYRNGKPPVHERAILGVVTHAVNRHVIVDGRRYLESEVFGEQE